MASSSSSAESELMQYLCLKTKDGSPVKVEKSGAMFIPWIRRKVTEDGSCGYEDKPISLPSIVAESALDQIITSIVEIYDDRGSIIDQDFDYTSIEKLKEKPKDLLEFAFATCILEMVKQSHMAIDFIDQIFTTKSPTGRLPSPEFLSTKFCFSAVTEEALADMRNVGDTRMKNKFLPKLEQGRKAAMEKKHVVQEKKNPPKEDRRSAEAIAKDIEGGTSMRGKKDDQRQDGGKANKKAASKKKKKKNKGKQSTKDGNQGSKIGTPESPNNDSDDLPSLRYTINDDDIKKNIADGPSESLDPSEAYIEMVPTETIYEGIMLKLILERTQAWNGNQFSATRKKLLRDMISIIARFERANNKEGYLTLDNVEMIDYKTRILPLRNHKEGIKMPSYRQQLREIVPKIVALTTEQEPKLSHHTVLELYHFLSITPTINIGKTTTEKNSCYAIVDIKDTIESQLFKDDKGNMHLDLEAIDDIQKNIPNVGEDRIVDVYCGFKKLFDDTSYGPYANDVVGAFQYSRNAVNHVDRYIDKNYLTAEELDAILSFFFPKQLFELYRLLVDRGIDLNFKQEKPIPIF
ncbi:hypothetical protein M0R45_000694 [Rubus argutus]|uniref:Uncharacterized protein n=1 Tax=Rubus argutus TaxID=59490 RepID=A0AAW1VML7_RUBAR